MKEFRAALHSSPCRAPVASVGHGSRRSSWLVPSLSATAITPEPKTRTVTLTGGPLTLEAQTAKTLNDAFNEGKELFGAGETAGSISFSALAQ